MQDFKSLPKMQHFKEGGQAKTAYCGGGRMKKKEGGDVDIAQDKALIKKAFKQHDKAEHDKEPTEIKLRKGGRSKKESGTVRKFKVGGKVKKYAEGGVPEGENAGIGDDTRARALKWVQEQESKGSEDEGSGEKVVSRSTKAKVSTKPAKADDEAGNTRGRPAEGGPKAGKTRSEAREPSGEPTPSRGNSASGSELGRNVKNTLMAMGPTRLAGLGNAAAEGAMASRAAKAVAAREAKTMNPSAWMAGPKGMRENFKSGRSVKRFADGGNVDAKVVSDKASRDLEEALNPISMAKELYGKAKDAFKGSRMGSGLERVGEAAKAPYSSDNIPATTFKGSRMGSGLEQEAAQAKGLKKGGKAKKMNTGGTAC